jgi:mono/diheme cytochrome c family protein
MVRHFHRVVGCTLSGFALTLLTVIVAACSGLSSEPQIVGALPTSAPIVAQPISLPQAPPDLALGAQIYAENCTRCHGVTGTGDGELVVRAGARAD